MINKLTLFPSAKRELEESHDWYEEQLIGLGNRFLQKINYSFDIIALNPESFPKKSSILRVMTVKEFPFLIIYEFVKKENVINVIHIFHTSRNPKLKYKRK